MNLPELTTASSLVELPTTHFEVSAETICNAIHTAFAEDRELSAVTVAEDDRLVGVVSREKFHERLGKQFGREIFINRSIREMMDFLPKNHLVIPSNARIHEAARAAFERAETDIYEPIVVQYDQSRRLLDVRVLLEAQTRILSRQILDHMRAVQAARAAEDKYRSIFEHAIEGMYQLSPDGGFVSANPAMSGILGYETPEDLIGSVQNAESLFVLAEDWREFLGILNEKGYVADYEWQVRCKDGSVIWASLSARATKKDNRIVLIEGAAEDITERRNQQELRKAMEAAEASSRAKSEFLANMSHEIRTPLNGIIGALDLMSEGIVDERQNRFSNIARSSATRLLHLINDILDFSKIEADRLELEASDFSLKEVVEQAMEQFGPVVSSKKLELAWYVDPSIPVVLRGDSLRLGQIISNLVNNAIKFTSKGSVSIRADLESLMGDKVAVRIKVADTGIGIPPERLNRLFKSFSQVDASTTRQFGGTGLGLAISKRLVEKMGGQIGVESVEGSGSTFWFTATLERPPASQATMCASVSGRGAPVLIVDDNEVNRDLLRSQLNSWGFQVLSTSCGPEALAAVRSTAVELVVTDMHMPGMDGLELTREIGKYRKDLPVILLSSMDDAENVQEARAAGVCERLTKPPRQSVLFDAVVRALAGKQSRKAPESASAGSGSLACKRLLLVEDNEINQEVEGEMLRALGCDVTIASDGVEAVEAVSDRCYDAVLMDCQMPRMDGFEATRKIREMEAEGVLAGPAGRRMPILALTANAIKGDEQRCFACGMDRYVCKPIEKDQLIKELLQLLEICATTQKRNDAPTAGVEPEAVASASDPEETPPSAPPTADAQASAPALCDKPIDMVVFTDRCSGSESMARRILEKFVTKVAAELESLSASAQCEDREQVAFISHSIKGVAANVAAEGVRKAAAAIEEMARSGDISELPLAVEELEKQWEACERFAHTQMERQESGQGVGQ